MTDDNKTQNDLSLKKVGLLLQKQGFNVDPYAEAKDVVETVIINKNELLQVCQFLKCNEETSFDLLVSVSAVDKIDDATMETVYHLFSTKYYNKIVLKVILKRKDPVVPSVCTIWATADWHERECYDLMGVVFSDHPNLERLLMPSDWIGFPLRKDYKQEDERLVWNER